MFICDDHQKCQNEAIQKAQEICQNKNLKLTPLREKVLKIIWQSHKPIKAYDLIKKMSDKDTETKPPTAYRTLEFLEKHRFIHKLQTLNAYTGCTHPSSKHNCSFLICSKCENIQEFCNQDLEKQINDNTKKYNFTPKYNTIEIQGFCKDCEK